MYTSVTHGQQL